MYRLLLHDARPQRPPLLRDLPPCHYSPPLLALLMVTPAHAAVHLHLHLADTTSHRRAGKGTRSTRQLSDCTRVRWLLRRRSTVESHPVVALAPRRAGAERKEKRRGAALLSRSDTTWTRHRHVRSACGCHCAADQYNYGALPPDDEEEARLDFHGRADDDAQ